MSKHIDHSDDDFSDGLDEFEESREEPQKPKKITQGETKYSDKPYDEGIEFSQDLSMADSYDAREKKPSGGGNIGRERKLDNDRYDEVVDVSMSMDQGHSPPPKSDRPKPAVAAKESPANPKGVKTTSLANAPFDEAFDVSQSGSDESDESGVADEKPQQPTSKGPTLAQVSSSQGQGHVKMSTGSLEKPQMSEKFKQPSPKQSKQSAGESDNEDEDDEDDDNADDSYENLEGAYNPKDYANLNVTADVKDLFQYIERFKPHEVELETALKCFIPEFIPAVGEIDAFVKVPKPDAKSDDLGLKFLDEPAAIQSDPTVLELQLRAKSKKQQSGDVAVRSIENAARNPALIDRWIQNISDLHRSKPPQQVHYKRNMPNSDALMDVWPEDFERSLSELALPSPDLDLSLKEYTKLLCTLLDIPVYENPIESLHVMFSLYMDFKNNAHFQAMSDGAEADRKASMVYGGDEMISISGPGEYTEYEYK